MATVATKITALADEVREISGATNKLSIDAMTEHVNNANNEVNSQASKIAEISALLDGKGVPGGNDGNVETCTVEISSDQWTYVQVVATMAFKDGQKKILLASANPRYTLNNVICGSDLHMISSNNSTMVGFNITNCEYIAGGVQAEFKITAPSGGVATIYAYDSD